MNTLDVILGGILIIAFVLGFRKGLLASLLSFLRFFIAGYIGIYYAADLKPYMHWIGEQEEFTYQIIAFILCFLAVSIALWFLSKFLTQFIEFLTLGVVNRLLGGVFNILKYALLLSFMLFAINNIDIDKTWITQHTSDTSRLHEPIGSIAPSLIPMLSDLIQDLNKETIK